MEVNTLTRRIDLFDQTVENIIDSIGRIANFIISSDKLYLQIKTIGFRYNEFSKEKSQFYIIFENGVLLDINNNVIGHKDDLTLDCIVPYTEWFEEVQKDYKLDIEEVIKLRDKLQEW